MSVIQIVSYILLIVSVASCKIVGLELFGVLQLAYYSISMYQYMPLYLQPIAKFNVFNGYNLNLTQHNIIAIPQQQYNNILPQSYRYIGIDMYFINNCNVMYLLMFAILITGTILYMIAKHKPKAYKNVMNIALRLAKQGFMCLLVFNCYNMAFSMGTQLKHAQTHNIPYYIGMVLASAWLVSVVIAVGCMQVSNPKHYGQLKQKFKSSQINKMYIPLTVCYRLAIGITLSTCSQQTWCILLTLFILLSFTLYTIINLPYKQTLHNYRTLVIHLSQIIIISICNYYTIINRSKAINNKGYILLPAFIIIICIICSVLFSALMLIRQIYIDIKDCRKYRKVMEDTNDSSNKVIDPTLVTIQ